MTAPGYHWRVVAHHPCLGELGGATRSFWNAGGAIFSDGFESGDSGRWSATVP